MSHNEKNLVLIGMPGSGKSTIGIILAKNTSRDFVDTDVVIQTHEHRSLQDILNKEGYMALREIEEKWVMSPECCKTRSSLPGGSVVYSEKSMAHLSDNGTIVFLDVSLETLKQRITDYDQRGIARRPDQSFEDLFEERVPSSTENMPTSLYASDSLAQDAACRTIIKSLDSRLIIHHL